MHGAKLKPEIVEIPDDYSVFDFDLWQTVELASTKEPGTIVGRADFAERDPEYLVRYVSGGRTLVERWWTASALEPVTIN